VNLNSNEILVSVVAINYNNSKFVIETLNSIATQDYSSIELIIVDDCSTDDSPDKIEEWLRQNPGNRRLIRHNVNRGVCFTCNTGFRAASGKYVSYIATDDVMLQKKISTQVVELAHTENDVAAIYSDAFLIDEESALIPGTFIQRSRKDLSGLPTGEIFETLVAGNFIPAMSLMIKKEILDEVGNFDEHLMYEDYDMWLRLANKYKIKASPYISAKYRVRKGSLTSSIAKWGPSNVLIFSKYLDKQPVIRKLESIAYEAYKAGDSKTLNMLAKVQPPSKYIKRILRFVTMKIPFVAVYFWLKPHIVRNRKDSYSL
jgi:glycosyltransferase involved in cell wall biosynthesis